MQQQQQHWPLLNYLSPGIKSWNGSYLNSNQIKKVHAFNTVFINSWLSLPDVRLTVPSSTPHKQQQQQQRHASTHTPQSCKEGRTKGYSSHPPPSTLHPPSLNLTASQNPPQWRFSSASPSLLFSCDRSLTAFLSPSLPPSSPSVQNILIHLYTINLTNTRVNPCFLHSIPFTSNFPATVCLVSFVVLVSFNWGMWRPQGNLINDPPFWNCYFVFQWDAFR